MCIDRDCYPGPCPMGPIDTHLPGIDPLVSKAIDLAERNGYLQAYDRHNQNKLYETEQELKEVKAESVRKQNRLTYAVEEVAQLEKDNDELLGKVVKLEKKLAPKKKVTKKAKK